MNSSKEIDISKSSLIGLKAELLKKQEEVKKLKELHCGIIKSEFQPNTKKKSYKTNKGVEERVIKDVEQTEDDFDKLQKSREVLEAKARLYDKLKSNEGSSTAKTQYLIDFDLKQEIYSKKEHVNEGTENISLPYEDEGGYSDSNSDPENDWVDFVDALGRSRRCLKKDLAEMKMKDANLAESIRPPTPPPTKEVAPELLSWDMEREMLRKKWEEQETKLLGKKDIHYQDVLFDEVRPHGVGYFEFSTEESERLRQQQELMNMRKETLEQQEAAKGLRVRRQQQLEARLAAARRRKRERMGLPPEDPEPEAEVTVSNPEEEQQKTEKIEDLEESIKKIAPIRPWDIGKQHDLMSQDEWVEMKRSERPQEFAPPSSVLESKNSTKLWLKNKTSHDFQNDYHKKNESGFMGRSFKTPNTTVFTTSTDSFQKINSTDSVQSKNNIYQVCKNTGNNDFESSVNNVNNYHLTINNRKPTSEDIDELLSKTKEKLYHQNASNSKDLVREQDTTKKTKYTVSTVKSPMLSNDDNKDTFKKTNEKTTPTFSNLTEQFNDEILKPENDYQVTQTRARNRIVDITGDNYLETSSSNTRKRGAEIPPPPSMSYYNNDAPSTKKQHTSTKTDILESISVGLNFLKSKETKKTRVKGLLDIV